MSMIRIAGNRDFNIALLISLAGHAACMFMVTVIILPDNLEAREYVDISFLGSILERTALQIMLADKPVAVETRYRRRFLYREGLKDKKSVYDTSGTEGGFIPYRDEPGGRLYTASLAGKKALPPMFSKSGLSGSEAGAGSPDYGLDRPLLYRPAYPELPPWIEGGRIYTMELDFKVSPSGEVEEVEPAVSCGLPEVDLIGIRYLKNWKFGPAGAAAAGKGGGRGRVKLTLPGGDGP